MEHTKINLIELIEKTNSAVTKNISTIENEHIGRKAADSNSTTSTGNAADGGRASGKSKKGEQGKAQSFYDKMRMDHLENILHMKKPNLHEARNKVKENKRNFMADESEYPPSPEQR